MKVNKIYQWVAWKLPAGIAMWCYIRVVSLSGDVPIEYAEQYNRFIKQNPHLTKQGYIKIVPKHDISTIVNNLKN